MARSPSFQGVEKGPSSQVSRSVARAKNLCFVWLRPFACTPEVRGTCAPSLRGTVAGAGFFSTPAQGHPLSAIPRYGRLATALAMTDVLRPHHLRLLQPRNTYFGEVTRAGSDWPHVGPLSRIGTDRCRRNGRSVQGLSASDGPLRGWRPAILPPFARSTGGTQRGNSAPPLHRRRLCPSVQTCPSLPLPISSKSTYPRIPPSSMAQMPVAKRRMK